MSSGITGTRPLAVTENLGSQVRKQLRHARARETMFLLVAEQGFSRGPAAGIRDLVVMLGAGRVALGDSWKSGQQRGAYSKARTRNLNQVLNQPTKYRKETTMNKKDYEAIAQIIADAIVKHPDQLVGITTVEAGLLGYFSRTNPRFSADKFSAACWPVSLCGYCAKPWGDTLAHDTRCHSYAAAKAAFSG